MDLEGSNRQVACGGAPTKPSTGRSPRAGFGNLPRMSAFKAGLAGCGLVFALVLLFVERGSGATSGATLARG